MAFSDKATGSAGTMRIDFDGTYIRFYLYGGFSTTFSGGLTWTGTVNGVPVNGTTPWPTGVHGAPGILFGVWEASYGTQTVSFTLNYTGTSAFGGPTTHTWTINRPAPTTVPSAPNTPTASAVTTTSMTLSWNIPANGGLAIDQMLLRGSTDPAFGTYTDYINSGSTTSRNVTGLAPNTTYYWRVYAHNGNGYSAPSGTRSQATLPATAPGMSIEPTLSGSGATATMSPPGGASGVTKYTVERRVPGDPATSTDTLTTTLAVAGLTPGATYEWRASAWFGTYQSPWTAWTPVIQPNPNTNPGDYFDGSTAARDDLTFSWDGTANNSTSKATGLTVKGWEGAFAGTATGILHRVVGGFAGSYAARLVFFTDADTPGTTIRTQNAAGMRADVVESTPYTGSIHLIPARASRFAASIYWYDALGALLDSVEGDSVVVSSLTSYTRLSVTGTSPENAVFATVRVTDVAGASWVPALGGDVWLADAAMLTLGDTLYPYFDGSTPDAGQYVYNWEGAVDDSISLRQTIDVPNTELIDPDCVLVPAPPRPPVVPNTCIDEVGLWRRHWYEVKAEDVREWFDTLPTMQITTATAAERQLRIRFYANPFARALADIPQEDFCSEIIVSYLPGDSVLTLDGITESAWASVSGGASLNADHLLYGSDGLPATWPVMECGIGYYITVDSPPENEENNVSLEFELATRY